MHIVHFEIMDALSSLGYNPLWNESETGFRFNFNMELAVCRFDEDSMLVTFMVPCVIRNKGEDYNEVVRSVNSRNHVGRLVEVDPSAVSAVTSFHVVNMGSVDTQVAFAIGDLNRLIEDFYSSIL